MRSLKAKLMHSWSHKPIINSNMNTFTTYKPSLLNTGIKIKNLVLLTGVVFGLLVATTNDVEVFWCASCPWVKKYEDRMSALVADYSDKGFGFILVNSNDPVAYPEDNMDAMKAQSDAGSYAVPYVADKGSALAKAFGAKRTPHTFVFDSNNVLQYIGAIDDSPSNASKVKDSFLRLALDAIMSGNDVAVKESKSFGCKIKMQS